MFLLVFVLIKVSNELNKINSDLFQRMNDLRQPVKLVPIT